MIIKSLLDTDWYTFTQAQVFLHKYPGAMVRYAFKCRNNIDLTQYVDEIKAEILNLCTLRFKKDELSYLASIRSKLTSLPILKPDFIEYLRCFQLNSDYINIYTDNGELKIDIKGPLCSTIWFETPDLAIVSEVWGKDNNVMMTGMKKLNDKIKWLEKQDIEGFNFIDLGTRRRFSYNWQKDYVIPAMLGSFPNNFLGTSNVLMSMQHGLNPWGSMSHQYIQAHQQLGYRLRDSQKAALQTWADEYRGDLGIALTDTVGMNAFLRDFDRYFAMLYDGGRQDSGDPFEWGYKWNKHIDNLSIDPKTKMGVFSDSLNFEKGLALYHQFKNMFKNLFGIGTFLTNDMGMEPPNIVIKMVECNGGPVAKIPDSPGKGMCEDEQYEKTVKKEFKIEK